MKRLIRFMALWLVFSPVAGLGAAHAQTSPPPKTTPAGVPTGPEEAFVLGPDDVIEVTVRDHTELDHTLTVLPDGKIAFPTVGELQAAGKTPRALAAEIKAELETTLNNIRVTVTVKEVHSRRVSIAGPVKATGNYDIKRNWRVFDLVAAAGGLSAKPEAVTARIIRGGKLLPVDLAEVMRAPQTDANFLLEPNDLLLLDEQTLQTRQAQVVGQVAKPSVYPIEPGTTLLSLLAEAGNPTDKAALTRVYVLRGGAQIPLNLYPFLMEGKADEAVTKFKIQPGDAVYVPTQEARYAVQGQVGKPGYYTYPEKGKVTVLDALNEAGGGAGTGGDLSHAGVIRSVDGKYTVIRVNIDLMLKKGDLSKNMALQPGDVLYVPARSTKGNAFQNLLAPLSLLSILGFHL